MHVIYEKKDHIARIMLDRSEFNPINYEVVGELDETWRDFEEDPELWVAILGSKQKNFSAGFDINVISRMLEEGDYAWEKSSMFGNRRLGPDGHQVTKPIIGVFNGIVNGAGFWLFLQSDIRIASPEASFGLGEARLNFPVEFSALLPRFLPRAIISELLYTTKNLGAERFYELGLLNRVVAREELLGEAEKLAAAICRSGPASIRIMKQLVQQGYGGETKNLMELSAEMIVPVINSADTRNAVRCFLEKKRPKWKNT